jgi:ATP-dependent helicase HrpA
VTLLVPLAALNQVPETACEWLVPGLLEEKIAALIKGLPQSLRRNFVPVPEFARAAADALQSHAWGAGSGKSEDTPTPHAPLPMLQDALAAFLAQRTGQVIPRDAWRPEALPQHLRMNFRILDDKGGVLAEGRDLEALRRQLGIQASQAMARTTSAASTPFERADVTRWDFGDLPQSVPLPAAARGGRLSAFPALRMTAAGSVDLYLADNPTAAQANHRLGTAQLVWLSFPGLLKQTERDLANRLKSACLQYGLLFKGAQCERLTREVMVAAALACMPPPERIRNAAAFNAAATEARPRLPAEAARMAGLALEILASAQRITQTLDKAPAAWKSAVADLRAQLEDLVFPGFLLRHPPARLPHLPRYLKAMELRLGKLPHHLARDQGCMNEMANLLAAWRRKTQSGRGEADEALEEFRWLLEELRVSLFAQELKTPMPVSVKRLEKRWQEILR